jgi:hypothetical protein
MMSGTQPEDAHMVSNAFPTLMMVYVIFIVVLTRRPVRMLKRQGALTADTTVPLSGLSGGDKRRLARFMQTNVIRQTPAGAYYYDASVERDKLSTRLPYLIALGVALLIIALLLARMVMDRPR